MTAITVTVVPIPAWLGFVIAARKMSPFALEIASTTRSAVGAFVFVGEGLADPFDGEFARHLAGFVAAHAVGDDVHALRSVQVVFVVGPDLPRDEFRRPT